MSLLGRMRRKLALLDQIDARLRRVQEALGRVESRQLRAGAAAPLQDYEFQVYSQWGEDGILQRLTEVVLVARRVFVEFGVEDYTEANTRFLLTKDNWAGLVIDGSAANVSRIASDPLYWRHNLKAVHAFVTRENINDLLRQNGLGGDIGLLSIDIDGNDYWVWEAIDVVRPAIVVVEYNWRFGPERRVTVPYDAAFVRGRAHHSMVYYGASLAALEALGARKGFDLVGCNSSGNNAFFVRRELRPSGLPAVTAQQAFVPASFREARLPSGSMAHIPPSEEIDLLADLPLVEVPAAKAP
jgi:hypothetical protein